MHAGQANYKVNVRKSLLRPVLTHACHETWRTVGGGEEKKKELRSCVAHFFFSLLSELLLLQVFTSTGPVLQEEEEI